MQAVMRMPENRKVLAAKGKDAIDAEYKLLLAEQFPEGKVMELYKQVSPRKQNPRPSIA